MASLYACSFKNCSTSLKGVVFSTLEDIFHSCAVLIWKKVTIPVQDDGTKRFPIRVLHIFKRNAARATSFKLEKWPFHCKTTASFQVQFFVFAGLVSKWVDFPRSFLEQWNIELDDLWLDMPYNDLNVMSLEWLFSGNHPQMAASLSYFQVRKSL